MKATTTTKSLRFWIDEPPERCRLLYGVSDELTAAYNAILEYWETDVRTVAVEVTEAAQAAYHVWKDAPKETRGDKPKWWSADTATRAAFLRVGVAATSTIRTRLVDNMVQGEWLRDVKTYMSRRFKDHIAAGIRHRAKGVVISLDQSTMKPDVQLGDDGRWTIRCALWAQGTEESARNNDRWLLSPYDRKRQTWTIANLLEADQHGEVRGVKLVPPKPGAPAGKRRWSAMITVTLPVESSVLDEERPNVAGVDMGLTHFAVYSCPARNTFEFVSSRELQAAMEKARRRRRGVPRKRSTALGQKLGRRQDALCRLTARRLIDCCRRDRVGTLRVEDLTGIRDQGSDDADRNFALGARFPYYKLQTYLEQAAASAGVRLEKVQPAGTSQTCSRCAVRDPESRDGKRFVCRHCGYKGDADLNAANNIASGRFRRSIRPSTQPAGRIPSAAPDCTGEAVKASNVGAELQPAREPVAGGGDPYAGE